MASTMVVGVVAHPSPALEEIGRKGSSSSGEGEGHTPTKDGSTKSREGPIKGP